MLGRSASGVLWMFRYLERAENTARLLDAGFRMALTRTSTTASDEWGSVLATLGQQALFSQRHKEISGPLVFNFILRDRENDGSVLWMIEHARTNARMVRTAITREVWEATNEAWMVLREALSRPVRDSTLGEVLALVRRQTMLVRGAMETTMLRNEIFNFARIGTYLEAADNTARILDVKYHVLLPSVAWVGSVLDHAQWEMLLRSVAGERAFRWLNSGLLNRRGIAEFLILDGRFPRSIAYAYAKIASNMTGLAHQYGEEAPAHVLLREAIARLHGVDIAGIFDFGLHEFLTEFILRTRNLAAEIARDYRFVA
ncbi:MAG: alpha-E domain-containing protein [Sphingomonadales bacterium]|nr:alpha-E domain-containing protein [Sphingomonadales bacterium]